MCCHLSAPHPLGLLCDSTLPGVPFLGHKSLSAAWARGDAALTPPGLVTWDGLVGSSAKDLFHRVSIDGEFLPACPICLRGFHIDKGLLVDRHDLQREAQTPACLCSPPELCSPGRGAGLSSPHKHGQNAVVPLSAAISA